MLNNFKIKLYLGVLLLQLALVIGFYFFQNSTNHKQVIQAKNNLVKRFLLSDYCLSTESRHTRHLVLPELIAPFQDLPGYHDHFPSSTFFKPKYTE